MTKEIQNITIFEINNHANNYVRELCNKSAILMFVKDKISLNKNDIVDIKDEKDILISTLVDKCIWDTLPIQIHEVGIPSVIANQLITTITTRYYCTPIMTQVEFENALDKRY